MNGEEQMQDNVAPAPQEQHDGLRQAFIALVVIVVLGALGFWLYGTLGGGTRVEDLGDGRTKTTVREGDIVVGFPAGLILDENAEIIESYVIDDEDGSSQPVVVFRSNNNWETNREAYEAYLDFNNWFITHEALDAPTDFFYALKGATEVNITLAVESNETTLVTIGYLERPSTQ